jgi:hypothetical protein
LNRHYTIAKHINMLFLLTILNHVGMDLGRFHGIPHRYFNLSLILVLSKISPQQSMLGKPTLESVGETSVSYYLTSRLPIKPDALRSIHEKINHQLETNSLDTPTKTHGCQMESTTRGCSGRMNSGSKSIECDYGCSTE